MERPALQVYPSVIYDMSSSVSNQQPGKRAYKPVYDCKGVMAVKFNSLKQCADIVYKHVPLHDTYEERAPPPRKDAKRRRDWELSHPNR